MYVDEKDVITNWIYNLVKVSYTIVSQIDAESPKFIT